MYVVQVVVVGCKYIQKQLYVTQMKDNINSTTYMDTEPFIANGAMGSMCQIKVNVSCFSVSVEM